MIDTGAMGAQVDISCMDRPRAARIAIIANPTAGRSAAGRALPQIRRALAQSARSGEVAYYTTSERGEGETLARSAIAAGASLIVACGGDGTLYEVANAVLAAENPRLVLGLIPFGTGNDFARAVGLRGDLDIAMEALVSGEQRAIDAGMIEGEGLVSPRRFLVAAGIGFVADTARTVNAGIRGLTGPAAYVWGAIKTLRGFQPVHMNVAFDGEAPVEMHSMLMSISNVATTGGGIRIAPDATPDDGFFDVCIARQMSKARLLSKLPAAFAGRHVHDPDVTIRKSRLIEVTTRTPCQLWIEGEVQGTTPARFTIQPGALQVMLPRSSSSRPSRA